MLVITMAVCDLFSILAWVGSQYRNAVASGRCELGMLLDEVDPTLPRVGTDLIAT